MTRFISLTEAAKHVEDGQTLALGGMTLYRRPVAFVYELLRRANRPRDLTLLCFTAGYESDLLVGAGCVKTTRTAYFGLEAFGLAPMFTQMAQHGAIHITEETEASLVMGIRAQAAGLGFMPAAAWVGTDLTRLRPDVKAITDPYTGQNRMAFPAIPCHVAVIHALEADIHGNVKINNNLGIDLELVYAADTVIITVEKRVDSLIPDANSTIIPAPGADFIATAEKGAHPTSCHPLYPVAGFTLLDYIEACNAGQFDGYLTQVLKND